MSTNKTLEVLQAIIEASFGSAVTAHLPLTIQIKEAGREQKISFVLREELGVEITVNEIKAAGSLLNLSALVEQRLARDPKNYKKSADGELPGIVYYTNDAEGITISVSEGEVRNIYYNPTSKDNHLRCSSSPIRRQPESQK